jgi:FAD synthase
LERQFHYHYFIPDTKQTFPFVTIPNIESSGDPTLSKLIRHLAATGDGKRAWKNMPHKPFSVDVAAKEDAETRKKAGFVTTSLSRCCNSLNWMIGHYIAPQVDGTVLLPIWQGR